MPREFTSVGVVGLGTMGAGIAEIFARNGYQVVGVELNDDDAGPRSSAPRQLDRARGLPGQADRRRAEGAARAGSRFTTDLAELKDCQLVVEAVIEQLRGQAERDRAARRGARAETRSSPPTPRRCRSPRSRRRPRRPGRVVGIHFFNPAPVQKLVEVVRTVVTEPDVLEDVAGAGRCRSDKTPVVCGDKAGFIANTLLFGYLNHAVSMYEGKYASREDIDAAMRFGCGYPMGPLALLDLIGLDTAYEILDTMYKQGRDRLHAPAPILKQMVTAGLLGRKTGRGFYTYEARGQPGRRRRRQDAVGRRRAAAQARHQPRRRRRHRHDGQRHRRGLRQGGLRRDVRRSQRRQGRRRQRDDRALARQGDPARQARRGRPRPRCWRGSPAPPTLDDLADVDIVVEAIAEDLDDQDRRSSRTSTRSASPARSSPRRRRACRSSRWPRSPRGRRTSSACTSSTRRRS